MSDTQKQMAEVMLILKNATCKEIDGKRCFVLDRINFYRILDVMGDWPIQQEGDTRLAAQGLANFQLSMSVADKNRYFVVSEDEPMLDSIWQG